jgi:cysteine-S-conjugate beta-lyase
MSDSVVTDPARPATGAIPAAASAAIAPSAASAAIDPSAASAAIDPSAAFGAATEAVLRAKPSGKWTRYDGDVLPCWVADMDFPPAEPIRRALHDHVDHGSFGYPPKGGVPGLVPAVADRLATRFGWQVDEEAIYPIAGIIPGLFLGTLATTGPGEQVIVQPPVYPPFFSVIEQAQRRVLDNPLVDDGERYVMDLGALRSAITPATRTLMFCNPHNPTGRVFTRAELEALAEVVLEHRLWVLSDELHADLVFDGTHVPFASISPEIAQRTVTVYGPTKAFNLAGAKIGLLVAQNPDLLARLKEVAGYFLPGVNTLGQVATLAAYRDGGPWLEAALAYLRANRDHLLARLAAEAPAVRGYAPEGTYLVWLDFRAVGLGDSPATALLERGRVALNCGLDYGLGGAGFARFNVATSRTILDAAIDRIVAVVTAGPEAAPS